MIWALIFVVIGTLAYTFALWRRLKEDYISNQIFTVSFYSLFGFALGFILANRFFPVFWFWVSLLTGLVGLSIGMWRYKLRVLETLEAFVMGFLVIYAVYFVYSAISINLIQSITGIGVIAILMVIFKLLDAHYRGFTWYKSGRVGFTGLTVMGLFFLLRAMFAVVFDDMISFVGNIDAVISGILSFLSFLAVFQLARET